MRFATVADLKSRLSEYLALAERKEETIVVTRHGRPCALIQPISERDLEGLDWRGLARERLSRSWESEDDALYDYL
jgi:prevent-host-death family protein